MTIPRKCFIIKRVGRIPAQYRGIAQLVEQRSPKPRAEGSNPSTPANRKGTANAVPFLLAGAGAISDTEILICVPKAQ